MPCLQGGGGEEGEEGEAGGPLGASASVIRLYYCPLRSGAGVEGADDGLLGESPKLLVRSIPQSHAGFGSSGGSTSVCA